MTPRWLLWPFLVLSPIIPASAQDWPSKTVTVVVPFTPAGSTDLLARIAAQVWEQRIGKPFVVENRPGAGQQVGVNAVAKADRIGAPPREHHAAPADKENTVIIICSA